jgi:hypothetical protein
MATKKILKGGKLADPAKINDATTWVQYYNARYANLQIREKDGAYLVYDPTNYKKDPIKTISEEPAKVINVKKGYDAIVLANFGTTKELRDKAGEKLHALETSAKGKYDELTKEYKLVESSLFEKIDEMKITEDLLSRVKLIKEIGKLQHELALIDEKRSNARYSVRMLIDHIVPFKYIEHDVYSDKNKSLSILTNYETKPIDRIIELTSE